MGPQKQQLGHLYRLGDRITSFFSKKLFIVYVAVVVSVGVVNPFEVLIVPNRLSIVISLHCLNIYAL